MLHQVTLMMSKLPTTWLSASVLARKSVPSLTAGGNRARQSSLPLTGRSDSPHHSLSWRLTGVAGGLNARESSIGPTRVVPATMTTTAA